MCRIVGPAVSFGVVLRDRCGEAFKGGAAETGECVLVLVLVSALLWRFVEHQSRVFWCRNEFAVWI